MLSLQETIRKIKTQTLVFILRVIGFLFILLVLAVSFILWQQWQVKKERIVEEPKNQEVIEQYKKEVSERLAAPLDAKQYTADEKRRIMDSLRRP